MFSLSVHEADHCPKFSIRSNSTSTTLPLHSYYAPTTFHSHYLLSCYSFSSSPHHHCHYGIKPTCTSFAGNSSSPLPMITQLPPPETENLEDRDDRTKKRFAKHHITLDRAASSASPPSSPLSPSLPSLSLSSPLSPPSPSLSLSSLPSRSP